MDASNDDAQRDAEILKQFELNVQKILKHLIHVSINKQSDADSITEYKRLYSLSLSPNQTQKEEITKFSTHLKNLLQAIQQAVVLSC